MQKRNIVKILKIEFVYARIKKEWNLSKLIEKRNNLRYFGLYTRDSFKQVIVKAVVKKEAHPQSYQKILCLPTSGHH